MRVASILFAVALAMRLLFWLAGPDGGTAWNVGFQGDAPVWQDLAARIAHGVPDAELRLPWRAPGMLWLITLLWDGGGAVWPLRLLFVVAGAAIAPLLWLLLRGHVDDTIAALAGGLCAVSSNLILASSGVQVECLYLALVLLTLLDQSRLSAPHGLWLPLRWGVLHGLLCLLRAEHVLYFATFVLVAAIQRVRWRSLLLALIAAALVLVPWQLHAARLVQEFNAAGQPDPPLSLPWDEAAIAAVRELPAFAQRGVFQVVDATVRHRGGQRVDPGDLEIVREAYGAWPEPLPVPLIALYGPLSFFVANAPEAERGGTWTALDRPPPLLGGADRYPSWLRLPDGVHRQFSLGYPPHLDVVTHGYARGVGEILADPAAWGGRVVRKLWYALAGATGGVGGYALPIGMSGVRRPVDMVIAVGPWAAAWRVAVLVVASLGLWRLRSNRVLWPLLAFTGVKFVVIAMFFGQARHGVFGLPAVSVGVAAVLAVLLRRWPRLGTPRVGIAALALLLALEGIRAGIVTATIDGHPVAGQEPFPPNEFREHTVEFR